MQLHEKVAEERKRRLRTLGRAVPERFQGVSQEQIRSVLERLDLATNDLVGVVFALLDDETESWLNGAPEGTKFADGASTAGLACHVGILQRGGQKLDREGRDYWIKPLREIGAVEPVYLDPKTGYFVNGHPKPKSPNSAYRLATSFRDILLADDPDWRTLLSTWSTEEATRERLAYQGELAQAAAHTVERSHIDLIRAARDYYVPRFLPQFRVLYIDDSDGQRVSEEDTDLLRQARLTITLRDAMPDILLWNPSTDALWVIEAVTSDGEVDQHKVSALCEYAHRHGKPRIGFTTAYWTWKAAATRQGRHKNLAAYTYLWIYDDPGRHYRASPSGETYPIDVSVDASQ